MFVVCSFVCSFSKRGHFNIVPIMVGSINGEKERMYGQLLAKYFLRPRTLFVISSDFCHWGERFQYTYFDEKHGEIWRSIEDLDKQVGQFWVSHNHKKFTCISLY